MIAGMRSSGFHGQRYSRFVTIAKILLSAIAVSVLLLVVLWTQFGRDEPLRLIGITPMKSENSDDAGLLNPRFVGTDDSGRSFTISADLVMNPEARGQPIRLLMPTADIELSDGAWVFLAGQTAEYIHHDRRLDLKGDVSLFHDSGIEIHTEEASVDLIRRVAFSRRPTRAKGTFGAMVAEGFEVRDEGRRLFLLGRCRLNLYVSAARRDVP